ncbi:MAG: PadR family transcriptional regulator [Acidimicrobiales bacterium]
MSAPASSVGRIELSLTEWVVLALLAEGPTHGFAIAKALRPGTDLGRVFTVHRPLVYRALDRLVAGGLAESVQVERGEAGPDRTLLRPTRRGRAAVGRWLDRPVDHVRDLRIEFLVKLRLGQRRDRDPVVLVTAQRTALAATFEQLTAGPDGDVVDLWRHHTATAAQAFLESLAATIDVGS